MLYLVYQHRLLTFDNTMVMIDDEALKLNRLSLLADIASKTSDIADFTKILTK